MEARPIESRYRSEMRAKYVFAALGLALLLVQSAPLFAQEERTISHSTPAVDLRSVEVRGGVGSIIMTAAPVSEIRVSLRLKGKSSWGFFSKKVGDPNQVQLRTDKRGDVLELRLFGERENIEEQWTIEVPESIAARLTLDVGRIKVTGIRGGCDAKTDVGDIDLVVPEGSVTAESDVGDVRLVTSTTSYSTVDARTDV